MSTVLSPVTMLPFLCNEIQKIRHLLHVRRDVGIVMSEMDVVELNVDEVLCQEEHGAKTVRLSACACAPPFAGKDSVFRNHKRSYVAVGRTALNFGL
jgi:hypothetical protein